MPTLSRRALPLCDDPTANILTNSLQVPQVPSVSFPPLLPLNLPRLFRESPSRPHLRHPLPAPTYRPRLHHRSQGRWHYLEHDWWADEGGFSFELLGETHTLEVPEGVEEMVTLFHITGAYVYVDPQGNAEKVEDVLSKIKLAREHYERVGLGNGFVDQFIR